MASIWKGLCTVAKTAWNFAAPLLGTIAGESLKQVGNDLQGQNSEQDLSALNSKKRELNEQMAGMETKMKTLEKEFQDKDNYLLEKQRILDETAERLLREQESLKRAEAELENRQRSADNTREVVAVEHYNNTEKQVTAVRECLSQELARYERSQEKLKQKQNENDREYSEHRQRLEEAYKILKQNQSQIIHLLKTLPAIQKVKELHALTDVFTHNCKVFADDPDAMVDETRIMQRKYTIKLMEVRNVMLDGHLFPGSMRVWADGAVLDLHMLGFLVSKGVFSYKVVDHAKTEYQGYWDKLKVADTRHRTVTKGSDRMQEIEYLLESQFRNFDALMIKSMPTAALPRALGPPQGDVFQSSPRRGFEAAGDQSDRNLSRRHSGSVREREHRRRPSSPEELARRWDAGSSRDDNQLLEQKFAALETNGRCDGPVNYAWDLSEQQQKASRSSSRILPVVPSSGESAHNRDCTLKHGQREKQRYSQNHQEYTTAFSSSRNKRKPEPNRREPLDLNDQQNFQGSRHSFRDQQEYHGGRDGPENQQPSKQKYQARNHFPADQQESPEESGSSSDDQGRQHEAKGRFHLPSDKRKNQQNCSGKRDFDNNLQVNQQSDDSENDNFPERNAVKVHKSVGRRHSDIDQHVNKERHNYSGDRQGRQRPFASTKRESNQSRTYSRDPN